MQTIRWDKFWAGIVVVGLILTGGSLRADDAPPPLAGSTNGLAAGHSLHGEVFNEGPRQAAVLMPGTGNVKLTITSTNTEAQAFFNQGVGQLHGFWFFEADRKSTRLNSSH